MDSCPTRLQPGLICPHALRSLANQTLESKMDFRPLTRMDSSDDAVLESPWNPFYSCFGTKPVLVKQ